MTSKPRELPFTTQALRDYSSACGTTLIWKLFTFNAVISKPPGPLFAITCLRFSRVAVYATLPPSSCILDRTIESRPSAWLPYSRPPDRVWQRIKDVEGREMPSLPSLPAFDDSGEMPTAMDDTSLEDESFDPIHSTPAPLSGVASTVRPPSSTKSTARFAHSIASRSTKSSASISRGLSASARSSAPEDSFDISAIPSLPKNSAYDIRPSDQSTDETEDFAQSGRLGAIDDDELDISDALQDISRSNSPEAGPTPKKPYDYSVSLRSEPKPSPFERFRNVAIRRPPSRTLARTPSLTRTTPSPNSSTSHSTPGSTRSISYPRSQHESPIPALNIPLPRSATASPTAAFSPRTIRQGVRFAEDEQSNAPRSESEQDMSMEYQQEQTRDDREPTFSSEEGTRSSHSNEHERTHMPSPAEVATAFSSPAPGLFTPTPAFHPRPRARFNLPSQHSTTPQDDPEEGEETRDEPTWRAEQQTQNDPVTPHAHKRSFLMGVINSTAKPRRRFLPTPHPTRVQEESEYYDAPEDQTAIPATPATNLQSAFAGITPRPRGPARRRLSIPTTTSRSTTITAPSTQDTASGSESAYEEKASFISTTSSQDLTTHARANASFDPVIGLGDRGHGVGRFNAGKLNSYLHGLNRKLQEENETLVARLRAYEEAEAKQNPSQDATPSPGTSPLHTGS
ncbi:hypothetical protein QCA50_010440 [Cerrena zonata]|uniref:Uncharacterized protein n=1 Tax=Cerrena zonata TaxID=2478898 RepID=A0AAW0FYH3_9APHY